MESFVFEFHCPRTRFLLRMKKEPEMNKAMPADPPTTAPAMVPFETGEGLTVAFANGGVGLVEGIVGGTADVDALLQLKAGVVTIFCFVVA